MSKQFEIKDSGERRSFETGARRDVDGDKPRFDLIPITVLQKIIEFYPNTESLHMMYHHINSTFPDDTKAKILSLGFLWGLTIDDNLLLELIWICLGSIHKQEQDDFLDVDNTLYSGFHIISPKTYLRLANHYGGGAKKYDSWNWSKGIPFSVFHASLMRHIFAIITDETDEDHWSAIFFNAASILHFRIINREDIDDVTPRLKEWGCYEGS